MNVHRNLSLRDAVYLARKHGCTVTQPRGTGELLFVSPTGARERANCRRKDAPRKVLTLLRRLPVVDDRA